MKLSNLLFLFILSFFTIGCNSTGGVMSLGVSSDGRYAISTHGKNELILWDIAKKEKKLLSKNANSYSAYFIPDSHEFMWQDNNNVVHIQNVSGSENQTFNHFETEGHIITTDKLFYLSANKWGKLYKGYGANLVPVYTDTPIGSFQPYNLSIVGEYFLSATTTISGRNYPPAETKLTANPVNPNKYKKSSYDGVTLWSKQTLKPIARLWGNQGSTSGTISPDGKWIVTGGGNGKRYMWLISDPHQRFRLADIHGLFRENIDGRDMSKLLPIPEKFKDKQITRSDISAVAFVTEKDFIL
ncbi:hypothetical protein BKG96_11030, partial [Rodentibacter caecimuris]